MATTWQDFNINNIVRVKLTDYGRKKLRQYHEQLWATIKIDKPPAYRPPTEDADGWSEWQLWSLMQQLGSEVMMGGDLPFITTIQIERKELGTG